MELNEDEVEWDEVLPAAGAANGATTAAASLTESNGAASLNGATSLKGATSLNGATALNGDAGSIGAASLSAALLNGATSTSLNGATSLNAGAAAAAAARGQTGATLLLNADGNPSLFRVIRPACTTLKYLPKLRTGARNEAG